MWKVILGTWTNAPAVHAGRAECCVTLKYAPLSSVRHQPRPKEPAATSAKVSFHSGSNSKCVFFFPFLRHLKCRYRLQIRWKNTDSKQMVPSFPLELPFFPSCTFMQQMRVVQVHMMYSRAQKDRILLAYLCRQAVGWLKAYSSLQGFFTMYPRPINQLAQTGCLYMATFGERM